MKTSQQDLIDRVTGGRLAQIVANAPSYQAARDQLRDEYEITVSTQTLHRWYPRQAVAS